VRRNNAIDWEQVRTNAKSGNLDEIPADIYIRYCILILVIIGPSLVSLQLIREQMLSFESASFFGDGPQLERVSAPGRRRVYRLMLRIPEASGGADIRVRYMLSSMNFEVGLTFHTSYDGWTDIQYVWKQKVVQGPSWHPKSGLPAIWTHGTGTPI
jgi:hypothetical protein